MIENGLKPIAPDSRDYSFLHTFGDITPDPSALQDSFSIYDGRPIPNQNMMDTRFNPPLLPMPYGCTGETTAFMAGLQDGKLHNPEFTYRNTPPYDNGGRDIRKSLQTTIDIGLKDSEGTVGYKRTAYFNVYGKGKIDDFDAARIAIWINQQEKRAVSAGTWWYPEFGLTWMGKVSEPSFNTKTASLHDHLITGWDVVDGEICLEDISWQGETYGKKGINYINRRIFNKLITQPYTGMFTLSKTQGREPITLGMQVHIDHLVAFIRSLFNV